VRLLALFATAFVGLIVDSFRSNASPVIRPAATAGVRLMTYNVNYGNPNVAATLDAIAHADADVVLLQEITTEWRDALDTRFAAVYPHRAYRIQSRAAGGLAVLSKLPIESEELLPTPRDVGAWFPASRLVVASPFGPLQILNVHLRPALDQGSWIRGYLTTPPVRKKEIEAHWQKIDYQLPTIVAGDFNEEPTGEALAYLAKHGMTRITTTGPTTWHYEQTYGGRTMDLLKLDIDHVMLDSQLVASDAHVVDAGTSDHRPVIVTITRKN